MEIKAINTRPIKSTILFENHKKNKENWLKKAISRTNEFINDYPKSERKKLVSSLQAKKLQNIWQVYYLFQNKTLWSFWTQDQEAEFFL